MNLISSETCQKNYIYIIILLLYKAFHLNCSVEMYVNNNEQELKIKLNVNSAARSYMVTSKVNNFKSIPTY